VRHDDEVDVAVLIGVADGERALEIGAAEVVGQDLPDALDELVQDRVQVRVGWAIARRVDFAA